MRCEFCQQAVDASSAYWSEPGVAGSVVCSPGEIRAYVDNPSVAPVALEAKAVNMKRSLAFVLIRHVDHHFGRETADKIREALEMTADQVY